MDLSKTKEIIDILDEGGDQILCPICGEFRIKIDSIDVNVNGLETDMDIDSDNKVEIPLLLIKMICKNKHSWKIVIDAYHKGVYIVCRTLTEISYQEYIKSSKWKIKAHYAKERANCRCQVCNVHGSEIILHAHHKTYERLGDEDDTDIIVLCASCHAKFHNKLFDGKGNGKN